MMRKTKFYIFFGLLAIPALAAGLFVTKEHTTMALAESQNKYSDDIPFIDQRTPTEIETATFALG